jgi:protein XRP2
MGCSSSKEQERPKAIVVKKTPAPSKVGLKLEDFYFKHLQEGCHIRQPGSIQGQQFIIEDCSNCDIFLLDHIAAVNIDNCTNVRIVIGACETSIFIRDCIDCVVIAATQQLRTRNCTNLGVLLCTTTGPIIESSKRVRIGCFTYDYFGFTDNLQAAGTRYSTYDI